MLNKLLLLIILILLIIAPGGAGLQQAQMLQGIKARAERRLELIKLW